MITMAANPRWKWLFQQNRNNTEKSERNPWMELGVGGVFTHRSWVSMQLIFAWIEEYRTGGKRVCVFFPEYYCYDTVYQVASEVDVVYYPVNDDLSPNMAKCRELAEKTPPDVVVFCHYFGKQFQVNEMSVFAKRYGAVLIEDAVHVLYNENIGKNSDFIIYSPWKLLGLPDGAIIIFGKKNRLGVSEEKLKQWFIDKQKSMPLYDKNMFAWKMKKLVQKICPNMIGKIGWRKANRQEDVHKEIAYQISKFSLRILSTISQEELLTIGERRKENYDYLKEYFERCFHMSPIYNVGNNIPYCLVYRCDEELRKEVCEKMKLLGNIMAYWPNLDPNISQESNVWSLSSDEIVIACHQGLHINKMVRRLCDRINRCSENNVEIVQIEESEYIRCINNGKFTPLLQSPIWGRIKEEVQHWRIGYYQVIYNGSVVACYMCTAKKCVISINRINQGVLWLNECTDRIKYQVYLKIREKHTRGISCLFMAFGENRDLFLASRGVQLGYYYRNQFYSTGILDISVEMEILREKLDSKWRNQLKKAESKGIVVREEKVFEEELKLLELHIEHKRQCNYFDSGDEIAKKLIRNGSIVTYVAYEKEELLGYIMLAIHEQSATYYIGWSSKQGYVLDVNKLLLWNGIKLLKEMNIKWLDLGGIDDVHTKSIAHFKRGLGSTVYKLPGEFLAW